MADEYWIVIDRRKWYWFKERLFYNKVCEYIEIRAFFDKLIQEHPNEVIRLGVTRGDNIYLL